MQGIWGFRVLRFRWFRLPCNFDGVRGILGYESCQSPVGNVSLQATKPRV